MKAKAKKKTPGKNVAVVHKHQLPEQDATLALIERAARDPKIDVGKMRELLQMRKDHEDDLREQRREDARMEYQRDMIEAQAEMEPVARTADNKQTTSKYAKLEHISKVIKPVYSKHGFAMSYTSPKPLEDGTMMVGVWVMHRGGHKEYHELPGKIETTGFKGGANMTGLQGLGKLISYLRRYLTCMVFDVILYNEDTDGQGDPTAQPDEFGELVQQGSAPKPVLDNKIPVENDGDWDGKTLIVNAKPIKKDFANPEAAADYLATIVKNHKSQASRSQLVNDNLALIRALAKAGKAEVIQSLHALVDAGTPEGGGNVGH
jgi:hypothetical protein